MFLFINLLVGLIRYNLCANIGWLKSFYKGVLMEHDNFLGGAFNKKMGELNIDKLSEYLSYSVFVHSRVLS